jgi:hypothetical protein
MFKHKGMSEDTDPPKKMSESTDPPIIFWVGLLPRYLAVETSISMLKQSWYPLYERFPRSLGFIAERKYPSERTVSLYDNGKMSFSIDYTIHFQHIYSQMVFEKLQAESDGPIHLGSEIHILRISEELAKEFT